VPGDVSVVGFDDIERAAAASPPLTTIRQPRFETGATAMRMLIDILDGRPPAARAVVLPTELIVRRSTAAPPKA
jgi:LacI family transcriptional regulator